MHCAGGIQGRALGLGVKMVNSWGMTMLCRPVSTARPVPCSTILEFSPRLLCP